MNRVQWKFVITAYDKPTDKQRWNGKPMASPEATEALHKGAEALQELLHTSGFGSLHIGYGVTAEEAE